MSDLLDLPSDLLPLILGRTQWSARRTCRSLLNHQSAGRTSFKLRWGREDPIPDDPNDDDLDDPNSSEKVAGLLAQMQLLVTLECIDVTGRIRNISPIAAVGCHLCSLELANFSQLGDFSPIGECLQLLSLKISGTWPRATHHNVVDLRLQSSCKLLTDVDLRGCHGSLSDLSPLAACVRIQSLHFSDRLLVADLSPLSSLVELTSLRLGSPRLLQHIDPLAACNRLKELRLVVYNQNPPLRPLASCQQLRSVFIISSCNGADLLPLAMCASSRSHSAMLQPAVRCRRSAESSAVVLPEALGLQRPGRCLPAVPLRGAQKPARRTLHIS